VYADRVLARRTARSSAAPARVCGRRGWRSPRSVTLQYRFAISEKDLAVGGRFDGHGRHQTIGRHDSQQRQRAPMASRCSLLEPLAAHSDASSRWVYRSRPGTLCGAHRSPRSAPTSSGVVAELDRYPAHWRVEFFTSKSQSAAHFPQTRSAEAHLQTVFQAFSEFGQSQRRAEHQPARASGCASTLAAAVAEHRFELLPWTGSYLDWAAL
jgi:hypothetical protein